MSIENDSLDQIFIYRTGKGYCTAVHLSGYIWECCMGYIDLEHNLREVIVILTKYPANQTRLAGWGTIPCVCIRVFILWTFVKRHGCLCETGNVSFHLDELRLQYLLGWNMLTA